nr:hypothetical protein [Parasutterella excrementihominis]
MAVMCIINGANPYVASKLQASVIEIVHKVINKTTDPEGSAGSLG